jgi:hypothetical protein
MREDPLRLRDPDVLRAYVDQTLRRVMPVGWEATFSGQDGLRWRLEPVEPEGSLERSFTVYAFTTPPTVVVSHGNSDGGGSWSIESMVLRAGTLIDLVMVGHIPLEKLLSRVLAREPDVTGLT